MATYKKFCMHCSGLIPGDSKLCPLCGADDPFELRCPKCRNPVERNWLICSSCGFSLNIRCPFCGKGTFSAPVCSSCGAQLIVRCSSKRCAELQVITASNRCLKCGKAFK
ncbi:MAG: zinc ribbon domain-containing protein [Bacillota bacterium]|nr:zinc ribbon domain-containing protein [Bacillota bacterium]